MKNRRLLKWFFLLLGATVIFIADFWSKKMVIEGLPLMKYSSPFYPFGGIGVFYDFFGIDFSIVHVTNHGVAWGFLASWQDYLPFVRIGLIIGLAFYLGITKLFFKHPISFAAILTGAVCNVVDYFVYGHVVDMLFVRFWGYAYPIFNIADSAIFCGVVSIGISSFTKKPRALSST